MSWSAWGFLVGFVALVVMVFEVKGRAVLKWMRTWPVEVFVSAFPGLYRCYYSRKVRRLKGDDAVDIVMRLAHELDDSSHPLLVPRRHLFKRRVWPHWSYGILVLFQDDIATLTAATDAVGKKVLTLSVDIRSEKYGIYRNSGKSWLERHSIVCIDGESSQSVRQILLERSNDIHQQMRTGSLESRSAPWSWRKDFVNSIPHGKDLRLLPLRWSSGGALPFVRLVENRQNQGGVTHVALFFRDLDPVGWNVANGASEHEDELSDFDRLTTREFSEELRVYSEGPDGGEFQEVLLYEEGENSPYDTGNAKKFGRIQRRLRAKHDRMRLKQEDGVRIVSNAPVRESPFVVNVTGGRASTDGRHRHSMVFTLSPFELGCEVLWLAKFDLYPGEFILDGEVDATNSFLIRRPVILISIDFLKAVCNESIFSYEQNHVPQNSGKREQYVFDKKYLQVIPKGEYKIFDEELQFGKRRLEFIADKQRGKWRKKWLSQFEEWTDGSSSFDTEGTKDRLNTMISELPDHKRREEFKMRLRWQMRYGALFKKYAGGDCDITDVDLLAFCPTTWKALELVFAHQLLETVGGPTTAGATHY